MRRTSLTLLTVLFSLLVAASCQGTEATPPEEEGDMHQVLEGNTAFAVDLYQQLRVEEGNLFLSPYSVSLALGMTYGGARGKTAEEMATALHFPDNHEQLHPAFEHLNQKLAETVAETGQKLDIANGLCLTEGNVSPEFKALLRDSYEAELFSGDVNVINAWVKDKTHGKIEKILEQLSANSVCVLLNAIYFKGLWESQFKEEQTRDAPFSVSPDKEVTVPLMHQRFDLKVLRKEGFQVASMPYKGERMSMVIFLPNEVTGLPALEKQLSAQKLHQWLAELDKTISQEIDVYLPKFKLETEYDLVNSFKALGMQDAFQRDVADFRGMGWPKGDLWIAQVKHKAFVEVNEEGTEAAAATAVEMITKAATAIPPFRADHPFLFLVRDNQTGAVLFLGRLVDPTAK
ncbi:MAG: serpin family protein [Candidatus Hydrogenedentes bacterium]|nr:serpin family protein [Candidatus Hydrogenedentota bacterium]